jgi:hypothetical protein
MRYHSMEEHEALLMGLNTERKLRQRIEELQVVLKHILLLLGIF